MRRRHSLSGRLLLLFLLTAVLLAVVVRTGFRYGVEDGFQELIGPHLDEYLQQYEPTDTLFTCTARNLEYILSHVGEIAGLSQGQLSFENLRWASALRALDSGLAPKQIRQNLGVSPVTWRETKAKLEKLRMRQHAVN